MSAAGPEIFSQLLAHAIGPNLSGAQAKTKQHPTRMRILDPTWLLGLIIGGRVVLRVDDGRRCCAGGLRLGIRFGRVGRFHGTRRRRLLVARRLGTCGLRGLLFAWRNDAPYVTRQLRADALHGDCFDSAHLTIAHIHKSRDRAM
jgi:hypothetical protein